MSNQVHETTGVSLPVSLTTASPITFASLFCFHAIATPHHPNNTKSPQNRVLRLKLGLGTMPQRCRSLSFGGDPMDID